MSMQWGKLALRLAFPCPLQWRHKGGNGISNHQPHDCLLYRLFRRRSEKISKLRITGHCGGIPRTKGQERGKCIHLSSCIISSCLAHYPICIFTLHYCSMLCAALLLCKAAFYSVYKLARPTFYVLNHLWESFLCICAWCNFSTLWRRWFKSKDDKNIVCSRFGAIPGTEMAHWDHWWLWWHMIQCQLSSG